MKETWDSVIVKAVIALGGAGFVPTALWAWLVGWERLPSWAKWVNLHSVALVGGYGFAFFTACITLVAVTVLRFSFDEGIIGILAWLRGGFYVGFAPLLLSAYLLIDIVGGRLHAPWSLRICFAFGYIFVGACFLVSGRRQSEAG
jgi:hypothetical protein